MLRSLVGSEMCIRDSATDAEKKLETIVSGDPLSLKYDKGSLRDSNNRLALAMTSRGNAWQGSAASADGLNKFTLKNERNLEEEPSLVGAIMYAFSENNGSPVNYIGSVSIKEETATEFTLEPVDLIDTQRFENPQKTWTLFEKMPQDQHGIFKSCLLYTSPSPRDS